MLAPTSEKRTEKRRAPQAILLSVRDYVRLAAPEPEILKVVGEESRRKGTDRISSSQIDRLIRSVRNEKARNDKNRKAKVSLSKQ